LVPEYQNIFVGSEDEFFALRALLEKREKQLRAEQSIRRQVEQQLDQA